MAQFHPLAILLTENQQSELLTRYDKVLANLEQKHFLTANLLEELKPLMRKALESQQDFADIYQQAELNHCILHLMHADNRLLNLPWRLAVEERDRLYLTSGLEQKGALKSFVADNPLPLKILVMVSAPEGLTHQSRLNYEEEELKIIQAFEPLLSTGKVQIDFTDDGSLDSLEEKLKKNRFHILHFSGHGVYKNDTGYLLLEDERTLHEKLVPALDFAKAISLREKNRPDLVLLSSCQTAQGSGLDGGFKGVANKLLGVGVPAVVAMGFSILDLFATEFAAELYRQLASEEELCQSFHKALAHIRAQEAPYAQSQGHSPSQWMIPQLYLSQQIDNFIDWQSDFQELKFTSYKFATGEQKLLLDERKGYLFIGRRRERRDAQQHLAGENKAVLLRGMGGVGKTALSEHILARMVANDPSVQPFVVNEKDLSSLEALLGQMQNYLQSQHRRFLIVSETSKHEKATDQFRFLLGELDKVCHPVFLFDNLESFQKGPEDSFKAENSDILEVLQLLLQLKSFPLILTGRYPLKEFPDLPQVNLNTVRKGDFYRKCLQLHFAELLQQSPEHQKKIEEQIVSFDSLVSLLHQTLGGNYRALEFFDELYQEKKEEISETLKKLGDFRKELETTHTDVIQDRLNEGARNLIFEELYSLLTDKEKKLLQCLAGFRIPVLELALSLQGYYEEYTALDRLNKLTLIEKQIHPAENEDLHYYYVPPLVRNFLAKQTQLISFDHEKAGHYFEYSDRDINQLNYTDLEEAFWNYVQIKKIDKVNKLGERLCNFYYEKQLFQQAYFFGIQTDEVCNGKTSLYILNHIGQILQIFGHLDLTLPYFKRVLTQAEEIEDLFWQGTTLNNISQIYDTIGEYDTALQYLEKSLIIWQQIGDRSGESITLNNISQIYYAKNNYDTALQYLKKSLIISHEIGNRSTEGMNLNNISLIYSVKGDNDTALQYLERSLKIRQQIGDKSGVGGTLNNIGQIYSTKGDYDTALQFLEKSLIIWQQIGDRSGEGTTLNNIGQIYSIKGDYDTALQYLERSLNIQQQIGDINGMAITMLNMGAIYFQQKKQPDEAFSLIYQAYSIFQKIGSPNVKAAESWLNSIIPEIGEDRAKELISQLPQNP